MMTVYHDKEYLKLVRHVFDHGVLKPNRTGKDAYSVFGYQMRFDLRDGTIPLLTTKKMHTRSIIHEVLWYLQGGTNIQYLTDNNVTIWDEWADKNGNLGPVYGHQWRNWQGPARFESYSDFATGNAADDEGEYFPGETIDQIALLVDKLKNNPNDRRMIVSAWNVGEITKMALPPCHYTFQCFVTPKEDGPGELSLLLNQRSCDVGLGVPFNIVQYSILLRMLAEVTGLRPGELVWNGGDTHMYANHANGLQEQLTREDALYPSPTLTFARRITDIDDFKYEDFVIHGYQSHAKIILDVAV
jgi:thymidylate synthase